MEHIFKYVSTLHMKPPKWYCEGLTVINDTNGDTICVVHNEKYAVSITNFLNGVPPMYAQVDSGYLSLDPHGVTQIETRRLKPPHGNPDGSTVLAEFHTTYERLKSQQAVVNPKRVCYSCFKTFLAGELMHYTDGDWTTLKCIDCSDKETKETRKPRDKYKMIVPLISVVIIPILLFISILVGIYYA